MALDAQRLALAPLRDVAKPDELRRLLQASEGSGRADSSIPASRLLADALNAAVDAGVTSFPADFAEEVCADPTAVSSDPEEAALLDGDALMAWASATAEQSEGALEAEPWAVPPACDRLPSAAAAARVLGEEAQARRCERAHLAARVANTALRAGCPRESPPSLHKRVERRRLAHPGKARSFLDAALERLDPAPEYRGAHSFAAFARDSLLAGGTEGLKGRTRLIIYRLVDEGTGDEALREVSRVLEARLEDASLAELELLLDDCRTDEVELLFAKKGPPSEADESHVRALMEQGLFGQALELARGACLDGSQDAMAAKLELGLLTEAFEGALPQNIPQLLAPKAEQQPGGLYRLLAFPFSEAGKAELVSWLRHRIGQPAGEHFPLFYMRRQQYDEALAALNEIWEYLPPDESSHEARRKCAPLL